jgi:hypothetical protein
MMLQEMVESYGVDRAERMHALEVLGRRVDAMESSLYRQHDYRISSSRAAVLSAGLLKMEQQIRKNKPLKSSRTLMLAVSSDNPLIQSALSSVPEGPVSSVEDLKTRFVLLERRAREADLLESSGSSSMLSVLLSSLFAGLLVSERHLETENSNQSRLSRAGWYLSQDDLLGCCRELSQLSGLSADISSDWLREAQALLAAQRAVKILGSELLL